MKTQLHTRKVCRRQSRSAEFSDKHQACSTGKYEYLMSLLSNVCQSRSASMQNHIPSFTFGFPSWHNTAPAGKCSCLWSPQLRERFGDKGDYWDRRASPSSWKRPRAKASSWQLHECHSSSGMGRRNPLTALGVRSPGRGAGEEWLQSQGSSTALPRHVHPSLPPAGDTAAPSRWKGNVLYILFQ